MAKGKLVKVCILYIVTAAAVGGSYTKALFIGLRLRVNTRSSLDSISNYPSFSINVARYGLLSLRRKISCRQIINLTEPFLPLGGTFLCT